MEMNKTAAVLKGSKAITSVNSNLDKVAKETTNSNLKITLPNMMIRR